MINFKHDYEELSPAYFLMDFMKTQPGNEGFLMLLTSRHGLVPNQQEVLEELLNRGILTKTCSDEVECYFYTQPRVTIIQLPFNGL